MTASGGSTELPAVGPRDGTAVTPVEHASGLLAPSRPAIYSMTGFARLSGRVAIHSGASEYDSSRGFAWTLTIKSVNHRFLDLHLRMPAGCESLEMRLRRMLKQKVIRGHLEITLNLDRISGGAILFDHELLRNYVEMVRTAARENKISAEPDLNAIFRMPGVLGGEARSTAEEMEALESDIAAHLDRLVEELNSMRAIEGEALARELAAGMERLQSAVRKVAGLREDVQKAYFERISQRLSVLIEGAADPARVLEEAAVLAERSDIEEEITRMDTHIQHFRSLLEGAGEIGKKLDFLLQEMNREANTLLSKTGGVSGNGQKITELGLAMKSEIEKAREQVQNLE